MKTINTATTNNNVNSALPATVSTEQASNSKIFSNTLDCNGRTKGMRPMSSLTKTPSMMPIKTAIHLFKK